MCSGERWLSHTHIRCHGHTKKAATTVSLAEARLASKKERQAYICSSWQPIIFTAALPKTVNKGFSFWLRSCWDHNASLWLQQINDCSSINHQIKYNFWFLHPSYTLKELITANHVSYLFKKVFKDTGIFPLIFDKSLKNVFNKQLNSHFKCITFIPEWKNVVAMWPWFST